MLETVMKNLTVAVTELAAELRTARLPEVTGAPASALSPPLAPAPAPKAEETPSPAPAAVSEPAPTPVAAAVAAPEAPTPAAEVKTPTKKQLVEKFIELAQTKDREVAVKLLADFGVAKLPDLKDKSKWADFVAAVDALLAG